MVFVSPLRYVGGQSWLLPRETGACEPEGQTAGLPWRLQLQYRPTPTPQLPAFRSRVQVLIPRGGIFSGWQDNAKCFPPAVTAVYSRRRTSLPWRLVGQDFLSSACLVEETSVAFVCISCRETEHLFECRFPSLFSSSVKRLSMSSVHFGLCVFLADLQEFFTYSYVKVETCIFIYSRIINLCVCVLWIPPTHTCTHICTNGYFIISLSLWYFLVNSF